MFGLAFLVGCLVCSGIGMACLARYCRATLPDPVVLAESIVAFLGSALFLVTAAVWFFS
jgi:hypothetical protein